jgi:hypothetical protein
VNVDSPAAFVAFRNSGQPQVAIHNPQQPGRNVEQLLASR